MAERRPSLAEIALANLKAAGRPRVRAIVETSQACVLIWTWAKTTRDLGHEPTRFEHAQHWKMTERAAYRDLERFRRAFPTERDPQNLANWLNARYPEATEARVMALPAPARMVLA